MTTFASILAVALSLASTNDYRFFSYDWPTNADIRGIGMGEDGLYSIPRLEDAAFLTEAWMERADALNLSYLINTNRHYTSDPSTPLPIVPRSFTMLDIFTSPIVFLFPESFDSIAGLDFWYRGSHDSFTSKSFTLGGAESQGTIPCNPDWTLGISTNLGSVAESYVPIIARGYERVTPPELATNRGASAGSVYRKDAIMQIYANLKHTGRIVNANGVIVSTGIVNTTSLKVKYLTQYPTSYDYARYTVPDASGHDVLVSTKTGYSLSPREKREAVIAFTYPGLLPEMQLSFSHEIYGETPLDAWWSSATNWNGLSVMSPYVQSDNWQLHALSNSPVIKVYSPLIKTNNYELCSAIEARLVAGVSRKVTKGRSVGTYSGQDHFIDECSTNHYITLIKPNLTLLDETITTIVQGITNVFPIFSTAQSVSDIILKLKDDLAEPDYMNDQLEPVYGRTDTFPQSGGKGDAIPSGVIGMRYHTREIRINWLRVIFMFNRDYHAKTKGS